MRAPLGGAVPTQLHPRLTVLQGTTTSDRLALQSVFRALVGQDAGRLEAVLEVNGVTVTLDDAFSDTFATRGAIDPVVVVGEPMPVALPLQEESRLDPLRAEQRSLAGELEVLEREVASTPSWEPLVELLEESLATRGDGGVDALELADRLEQLAEPGSSDRERMAALEQLLGECRQAIDAVRNPSPPAPVVDPTRVAALEQVREEMLAIAAIDRPGRRQRQRLEQLRATEARLLAELGQPTYVSLLAALAAGTPRSGSDPQRRAREAVLLELESFLLEQLADSLGGTTRQRLMAEAAAALGEPAVNLDGRDPRLVAARLRALPRGDLTDALRVAAALERELGLDTTVARTPEQVLEMARVHLAKRTPRWELGGRADGDEHLERRRQQLESRLAEVSDALEARERAAAVDLRDGASVWEGLDLAGVVHGARSVSVVGAMPLLLMESARRPLTDGPVAVPEPLTVAAMSAVTQLVWVTDRPEVASAVAGLGDLAEVIQV